VGTVEMLRSNRDQRSRIWEGEHEDDVVRCDSRVGNQNRETAGANCVLGTKIFLLHPQ
jgi:hypothetical protein